MPHFNRSGEWKYFFSSIKLKILFIISISFVSLWSVFGFFSHTHTHTITDSSLQLKQRNGCILIYKGEWCKRSAYLVTKWKNRKHVLHSRITFFFSFICHFVNEIKSRRLEENHDFIKMSFSNQCGTPNDVLVHQWLRVHFCYSAI